MRKSIDVAALTLEQARALVIHYDSRLDAALLVNNKLLTVLANTASKINPTDADDIRKALNEWSFVNNEIDEASADEIRRILGLKPTPPSSTLQ